MVEWYNRKHRRSRMISREREALVLLIPYVQWEKIPPLVEEAVLELLAGDAAATHAVRSRRIRVVQPVVRKIPHGYLTNKALRLAQEDDITPNILAEAAGVSNRRAAMCLSSLYRRGKLRRLDDACYGLPE